MSAKPKTSYVLVGLFVLLLSAAFIAALLWLTTGGPPKDYDFYVVYMTESVSGLNIDAPVKYKGVNVGRVRDIRLDPDNPEQVRVLLVVLEGTPVKRDTVATLAVQGLTGLAHLDLSGGSRDAPPLEPEEGEDYAVIPSRPSLLVRLDDTVSTLLGNLIETSSRLNEVLREDNQEAIAGILENTREMTGQLASRGAELEGLIREMNAIVSNARRASERLPDLVGQFDQTASALEKMADSLASAGETLEASSTELQETITTSGADLRRFTGTALPEATNLVVELRDTAVSLRRISESIEADPSQILFGAPEPQPGPGE